MVPESFVGASVSFAFVYSVLFQQYFVFFGSSKIVRGCNWFVCRRVGLCIQRNRAILFKLLCYFVN